MTTPPVATKRLTLYLTDAEWVALMIVSRHEKKTMHDWAKATVLGVAEVTADDKGLAFPLPRRP